jgi:tetratricopeptide (TPR) repeat protein
MRAESYWLRGDYEVAKIWGQRGVDFKKSTGVDTTFDSAHHLALAQRESGEVVPALSYFLGANKLDIVLSDSSGAEIYNGPFYGNIGRCLWHQRRVDEALKCYRKSAKLLEQSYGTTVPMNRGWARMWIAEALERNENFDLSYCFFRAAFLAWRNISPPKAQQALHRADKIVKEHSVGVKHASVDDLRVEEVCRRWIDGSS